MSEASTTSSRETCRPTLGETGWWHKKSWTIEAHQVRRPPGDPTESTTFSYDKAARSVPADDETTPMARGEDARLSLRGFELRDGADDADRALGHDRKGRTESCWVYKVFGLLRPIRCPNVAQVRGTWRHEVTSDGCSAMSRVRRRSPGSPGGRWLKSATTRRPRHSCPCARDGRVGGAK